MLRLALEQRGLAKYDNPHYNLPEEAPQRPQSDSSEQATQPEGDGGLFL